MQALEINDNALATARDGVLRGVASSGLALTNIEVTGRTRDSGNVLWRNVRRAPRSVSLRHLHEIAQHRADAQTRALAQRELHERAVADGILEAPLWLAVGARYDVTALGELLAAARAAGLQVAGFVDSAAVAAARLGGTHAALVVDPALFDICVSLVTPVTGGMQLRRSVTTPRGRFDMLEAWLALAAEAMVRRTRFDPLHDGANEQQLFDRLPALVVEAQVRGSAEASVLLPSPAPGVPGETYSVELTEDQLAAAAQPIIAELVRQMHELRPPGGTIDLMMPRAFAALPGMRGALQEFAGCELHLLPDGFGAIAASQLLVTAVRESGNVGYLRRVTRFDAPLRAMFIEHRRLGASADAVSPTHLLFAGGAYAIGDAGIVVGRAPGAAQSVSDPAPLRLPEGLAGVSRRHATVMRQPGGVTLIDHSSHGSFVNDERVSGRRLLVAGDRIRVGTPGVELAAIRVAPAA